MSELPKDERPVIATDSLHMAKGEAVILSEQNDTLRKLVIGLGWSAPENADGFPVDVDASAFLLNRDGRVRNDTDFIFYNNLETDGIKHAGDNTTGAAAEGAEADADKEVITVDLENIPYDVETVAFAVTVHNAEERQQTFGIIKGAYMRIVNNIDGKVLAQYDLTEDASDNNAMIFGELSREGMGWKFKATGAGTNGGLYKIAREYGVNVAPP